MPKKCEKRKPSIKVTMHVPATNWHGHFDKVLNTKAETEYQCWAEAMRASLIELTHGNLRLMVGYWGDALNLLPEDVRMTLVTVIVKGLGLSIKTTEDVEDSIEVDLVPRYEPLAGERMTESGIHLPPKPGENVDLILPGDRRYNERS